MATHVLHSLALSAALAPAASAAQAGLELGGARVVIGEAGVLIGVPELGLETLDGPRLELGPDTAEWFGLSFDGARGHVEAVAVGSRPDWSPIPRAPLRPVAFRSTETKVESISVLDDLLVRVSFEIDPLGPYLIGNVELSNRGSTTIGGLFLTREWTATERAWSFPTDLGVPLPLAHGICRYAWMLDPLPPGGTSGAGFGYALAGRRTDAGAESAAAVDVPLALWTSPQWPNGLVVGKTNGISFGDYDADGFIDIFALQGGSLIQNLGGTGWQVVANLASQLPPTTWRYGSSFGDYNNDGLPDIACEPRISPGDSCHHLFRALGGGPGYFDIAPFPQFMGLQACTSDSETICWGDTDGDGNLDWFLPVYPPSVSPGSPGNFFWHNQGPVAAGGEYQFKEVSGVAGLDNPPGAARPEGAQFVDTDFDGDIDLYSNGTLYQNLSSIGTPRFAPMSQAGSGIQFSNALEEGIVFHDVDLDGDFDLTGAWTSTSIGVRIHLAAGDGSYDLAPASVIDSHTTGLNLGISSEDWDNDGDMDLTTRAVFRRNQLVETGALHFTVATHAIPAGHLTSATPAWGDVDRDGDLDCALGNWLNDGHYYANTLYDAGTPAGDRRYVRVRVLRDTPGAAGALETEYGATVEIRIAGEEHQRRRRKFVSSSAGYLNQNEYTLHFGLPADPFPADPSRDLVFDVSVDLAGVPAQGFLRVDKHVNPVLGGVQLAELDGREIVVQRSGEVHLDGVPFAPAPTPDIALRTTTDGLIRALPKQALPPPSPAPGADHFAGIELDTLGAVRPVRLTELLVDGTLDQPQVCAAGPVNVLLWDVTSPASPALVSNGAVQATTLGANDRSYFPFDALLAPGRVYRLVARVTRLRGTPILGPVTTGPVRVSGGLSFADGAPCSGAGAAAAVLDASQVYLACRFQPNIVAPFADLGFATAGGAGVAELTAGGPATPGSTLTWHLQGAPAGATTALVFGFSPDAASLFGGTLVPALDRVMNGLVTDPAGSLQVSGPWPLVVPVGSTIYAQAVIVDAGGPAGFALSNALAVTAQP